MLKKLVSIKNVGSFADFEAKDDIEFRKVTLLFGENGVGKSTLCDILRSAQTGKGDYITGRRHLSDNAGEPEARILIEGDNNTILFSGGVWNGTLPNVAIFDSTFVYENVYAGHHVQPGQRRSLYRVVVGEKGVTLAAEVDGFNEKINALNGELRLKEAQVSRFIPVVAHLSPKQFAQLKKDDDIDDKLEEQTADVRALKSAEEIQEKSLLAKATLPQLPDQFFSLLATELDDVSTAAEATVQAHLQAHLDDAGEAWLAQGLPYTHDNTCPFCGEDLTGGNLLKAYRSYFSQGYQQLKQNIARLAQDVDSQVGDQALLSLQSTISTNATLCEFWKNHVVFQQPQLSFDEVRACLEKLRRAADAYVQRKQGAPLEPLFPSGRHAGCPIASRRGSG